MASRRELVIAIVSDASAVNRGFSEAKSAVSSYGRTVEDVSKKQVGRFSQGITNLRTNLGGLATAFLGFKAIQFGREALDRAEEMNSAYAITEQVIKQTGGAANVTSEHIQELSKKQAILTGTDKALVTEGSNVLLTFKNIRNELGDGNDIFDRTSNLMLDISAVMGTDAKSAALQLGKALNDPVAQMGALSRAGLTFTQAQKDQIKEMVASGDLLSAQKLILSELESQLGGTAEASADATAKIGVAFDEIRESIGNALLKPLEDSLPTILGIIDRIANGLEILTAETPFEKIAAQTGAAVGGSRNLAIALAEAAKSAEDIDKKSEGAGEGGLQALSDTFREVVDESGAGVEALVQLRNSLETIEDQGFLTAEQAEALADVLDDRMVVAANNARDASLHAGKAHKEQGDAAGEAEEGVDDYAEANENAADALDRVVISAGAARRAFLEQADPAFAAASAMERMEEAQKHLTEVQEDAESTADDVARAQLDYAQSVLEAQAALDEFAADDAEKAISALATALDISREAAEELLAQLGILDGTVVDITIAQHGTAAGGGVGGIIEGFATGGAVSAKDPILVGEKGPEVFVPNTNGRIIPNTTLGTSSQWNLSVNVAGDVSDKNLADIQRELILASVGRWAENK